MKNILNIILFIGLFAAGCDKNQQNEIKNEPDDLKQAQLNRSLDVKPDSLQKGDIFVTTGPAGTTNQKEGRIVMYADSGKTMSIKMVDNVLLALSDIDSTTYRIKKNGNQTILVLPDSDHVLKDGRMMFLTDDGETLQVKIYGEKMVVITSQNTMLPLEKLE